MNESMQLYHEWINNSPIQIMNETHIQTHVSHIFDTKKKLTFASSTITDLNKIVAFSIIVLIFLFIYSSLYTQSNPITKLAKWVTKYMICLNKLYCNDGNLDLETCKK